MLYHSYDTLTISIASTNGMFVTHRDLIAETCLIVFQVQQLRSSSEYSRHRGNVA